MANKVSSTPGLPTPVSIQKVQDVTTFITQLINTLSSVLTQMATRLNIAMVNNGTEVPTAPVLLNTYVKTALPSASTYPNGIIIVSNDTGGLTLAFSDGTNWRRTADRNVIS